VKSNDPHTSCILGSLDSIDGYFLGLVLVSGSEKGESPHRLQPKWAKIINYLFVQDLL